MNAREQLENEGHAIVRGVMSAEEAARAVEMLPEVPRAGLRNAMTVEVLRGIAELPGVIACLDEVVGTSRWLVRAILFDKSPGANWSVPWHQDVTIAVRERVEVDGFGPWSVKDGVVHVTPPAAVLAGISTIRIHLDDCGEDNGALQVIPRSHLHGLLSDAKEGDLKAAGTVVTLEARAGDAVFFKPLTLHASAKAERPRHRRVLHLEYATCELPGGLRWPGE